jgi:hypothetical protein
MREVKKETRSSMQKLYKNGNPLVFISLFYFFLKPFDCYDFSTLSFDFAVANLLIGQEKTQ